MIKLSILTKLVKKFKKSSKRTHGYIGSNKYPNDQEPSKWHQLNIVCLKTKEVLGKYNA